MPFKDNANLPDGVVGWNGERSKRLGAAMLNPFWGTSPPDSGRPDLFEPGVSR
jgi:hypothetical protein